MKIQVLLMIIVCIILLISCTGCETDGDLPDLSYDPVDLTYNTNVLLMHRWVKETTAADPEYMEFVASKISDTTFTLVVYSDEEHTNTQSMGIIQLVPDTSATCTIGETVYQLKVSATETGVITLSLKNEEEDLAYYFGPVLITD